MKEELHKEDMIPSIARQYGAIIIEINKEHLLSTYKLPIFIRR